MRLNQIVLLGLIIRILVAIWNGFWGPSFGADMDAQGFHYGATAIAASGSFEDFKIGAVPYANFLGAFYYVTTDSLFLGSLLSCIAWLLSAQILASCSRIILTVRSLQNKIMVLYALLPSSIMFTAVTLRESYQLLFVNLAVYAILKIYLHKKSRYWFTLVMAIAGAGSLHGGLLAFGILLFSGALLLPLINIKKGIAWSKLVLIGAFAGVILWFGYSFFGNISYNLEDGLGNAVASYREGVLNANARTHYTSNYAISSFIGLLLFVPNSLFQYFFEPFPWHVSAASDVLLMLENILRAWLIFTAWKAIKVAPVPQRWTLLFIFLSYLMLETIWSLGTVNWGTAARHHIPSIGLLLLAAFAYPAKMVCNRSKSMLSSFVTYIKASPSA